MPQVTLNLNDATLVADLSGALWWPERRILAVADLHLEKGSGFASRGRMLPPYDTAMTLGRLEAVAQRLDPQRVICLGDSFHDAGAAERLAAEDAKRLSRLVAGFDWLWVSGNHDPAPPVRWGGAVAEEAAIGPLVFRHIARGDRPGEVSGHYHPKATVHVRDMRISSRCFVRDHRSLVLPAFGAFTGGLNVLDPAISGLFDGGFIVHLLGERRIHTFPRHRLASAAGVPARSPAAAFPPGRRAASHTR